MQISGSSSSPARICLRLLDSANGTAMQTWQFASQESITIGRASDRHVRVGDQHISRLHAELRHADGRWEVISHGRSGLLINGRRVERAAVEDRMVIQLGPSGPALSIQFDRVNSDSMQTIDDSALLVVDVRIDQERKAREVEAIADGEYFKKLRAKAISLREQA